MYFPHNTNVNNSEYSDVLIQLDIKKRAKLCLWFLSKKVLTGRERFGILTKLSRAGDRARGRADLENDTEKRESSAERERDTKVSWSQEAEREKRSQNSERELREREVEVFGEMEAERRSREGLNIRV